MLGEQICALHLMESPALDTLRTGYPVDGTHEVGKPRYQAEPGSGNGCVWLNEAQYFTGVPQIAWEFHIGGYQPAQKWLKDRRGRRLTNDELLHYQRMIVALCETERLMR